MRLTFVLLASAIGSPSLAAAQSMPPMDMSHHSHHPASHTAAKAPATAVQAPASVPEAPPNTPEAPTSASPADSHPAMPEPAAVAAEPAPAPMHDHGTMAHEGMSGMSGHDMVGMEANMPGMSAHTMSGPRRASRSQ